MADFKDNDSCAECFDANFEHLDSCARRFAQPLAFCKKSSISRPTTVAQSVSTQISSKATIARCDVTPISRNSTVAEGVFANLKQTANRLTLNIYSSKRIVAYGDLHKV